ncbi:MAG: serine/threonine-protein kinase [Planctomycetota bacterium]
MPTSGNEETRDITREDLTHDGPPPLPRTLKHYKVIREIGAGGMGRVLKCLDTTLNRYVAIKMLRPALSRDAGFVERFRREALAVAKTRHPNIVHIYSIDQEDEHVFYSMEYVEGEGLDQLIERRARIPVREAVEIIRQAAEGLSHVHKAGILHRDIKPSNLLMDSANRILLTDFGLAKMDYHQIFKTAFPAEEGKTRKQSLGETDPGRIMGTPYYMAPECISGRPPDLQSDIYSLGIVFYEILTGCVPFNGDTPTEIFQSHLNEIPVPIGELVPDASLKVANIVYRCIEKQPSSRYSNCQELLADLNEILAGYHMAKEIEEKKRLSMEIARAMTLETRPQSFRYKGRLIVLIMILAATVAFILFMVQVFEEIKPRNHFPGSHETDLAWKDGYSARLVGVLEEISETGGSVRLRVKRTTVEGQPNGIALMDQKVWGSLADKEKPRVGDLVCLDGNVEEGEGKRYVRIVSKQDIWRPGPPMPFTLDERGEQRLAWEEFLNLPQGTRVRISGTVLWRDAGGRNFIVADGWGNRVDIKLRPISSGTHLRFGDLVAVRGRIAITEDEEGGQSDTPRVDRAYLLRMSDLDNR